ncbi:hypothetical protein CR969_00640 [Candidatus Saccharibacteria bacterium]|nr:MAG: hypothetical protein CR969_00640 [Candidatus Saccharibacteria bacterium]
MSNLSHKSVNNKKKKSLGAIAVALIIVALLGLTGYFWNEARQAKMQTPQAAKERNVKETEEVLSKLKSVILVEDEKQPTVARVDDPEKLKKDKPEFYKNIQKGDYIIVYKQRAIIFRANGNGQIINIAPIINPGKAKTDKKAPKADKPDTKPAQ